MKAAFALVAAMATTFGVACAACRNETRGDAKFAVCEFNPATADIRLFLDDAASEPFGDFAPVDAALAAKGEKLLFAMNAGMYRRDRSPVGLYVENYEEKRGLSTKDGPGNFHLKPNGVFWIDDAGAHVTETAQFILSSPLPQAGEGRNARYATQSGPMLVIDGALHPRFLIDATSKKRRNGVGVRKDGTVVFAISDTLVTFYEFATFFRDDLACPNALYLDGTISRLYAPELSRADPGLAMGPIIGVVGKAE